MENRVGKVVFIIFILLIVGCQSLAKSNETNFIYFDYPLAGNFIISGKIKPKEWKECPKGSVNDGLLCVQASLFKLSLDVQWKKGAKHTTKELYGLKFIDNKWVRFLDQASMIHKNQKTSKLKNKKIIIQITACKNRGAFLQQALIFEKKVKVNKGKAVKNFINVKDFTLGHNNHPVSLIDFSNKVTPAIRLNFHEECKIDLDNVKRKLIDEKNRDGFEGQKVDLKSKNISINNMYPLIWIDDNKQQIHSEFVHHDKLNLGVTIPQGAMGAKILTSLGWVGCKMENQKRLLLKNCFKSIEVFRQEDNSGFIAKYIVVLFKKEGVDVVFDIVRLNDSKTEILLPNVVHENEWQFIGFSNGKYNISQYRGKYIDKNNKVVLANKLDSIHINQLPEKSLVLLLTNNIPIISEIVENRVFNMKVPEIDSLEARIYSPSHSVQILHMDKSASVSGINGWLYDYSLEENQPNISHDMTEMNFSFIKEFKDKFDEYDEIYLSYSCDGKQYKVKNIINQKLIPCSMPTKMKVEHNNFKFNKPVISEKKLIINLNPKSVQYTVNIINTNNTLMNSKKLFYLILNGKNKKILNGNSLWMDNVYDLNKVVGYVCQKGYADINLQNINNINFKNRNINIIFNNKMESLKSDMLIVVDGNLAGNVEAEQFSKNLFRVLSKSSIKVNHNSIFKHVDIRHYRKYQDISILTKAWDRPTKWKIKFDSNEFIKNLNEWFQQTKEKSSNCNTSSILDGTVVFVYSGYTNSDLYKIFNKYLKKYKNLIIVINKNQMEGNINPGIRLYIIENGSRLLKDMNLILLNK